MALDDLAIGLFGVIARLFFYVFVEVIFEIVLQGIGWLSLKIFTLGRYPKLDTSGTTLSLIGIATLVGLGLAAFAIAKLSGE